MANLKTIPRPYDRKMLNAALVQAERAALERDKIKRDALLLEACRLYRAAYEEATTALTEIERLQIAKRRALAIADERSRENVQLRAENEQLRAALAEARA